MTQIDFVGREIDTDYVGVGDYPGYREALKKMVIIDNRGVEQSKRVACDVCELKKTSVNNTWAYKHLLGIPLCISCARHSKADEAARIHHKENYVAWMKSDNPTPGGA